MPGGPSSLVLQRLGQIPVIQRDERGDPPGVETGDETAIEVEPGLIDPPVAIGDDPRPGDREPVRSDAQLCQQVEILLPPVEVVASDVARVAETAQIGEPIPDGVPFALLVAAAFDLVGGGGDTPGEIGGERPGWGSSFVQVFRGLRLRRLRPPSARIRP
jgi:hypothetical protein